MDTLGERLRAARESRGVNIAQAAAETRILQRYLVALEDNDYKHLPGDVYARGFIRNYADYLGLSADELIEMYRRERGSTEPIKVVPTTSAPRIRRNSYIPSFFGVFFVVLTLIGISYLTLTMTRSIGGDKVVVVPTATIPRPSPLPTSMPEATGAPVIANVPTATVEQVAGGVLPTQAAEATAAPPAATPEAPIVGEIRVADGDHRGSWMRVVLDGKKVYEGVLKPGSSLPIKAQRGVDMRVGSAGVVSVTINGQSFNPLGAPGQPLDWSFPPQ